MMMSIATVTLGGDLRSRLQAASDAGFTAVDLFDADLNASGADAAAVRQLIDATGLEIASYFPLREVEGVPVTSRQITRDRAARYLDNAAELGTSMVMICSATDEAMSGDRTHILDDLGTLADMARERQLRLAYEALSWGRYIYDYRDAAALVAELNHPNFGLVLDNFHIQARKQPLSAIKAIPLEQIFLVQISDAPALNIDYLEWSRTCRTLPGRGDFDLHAFTRKIRETGYAGVFSLECFSQQLKTEAAASVASMGFEAMNRLWINADVQT